MSCHYKRLIWDGNRSMGDEVTGYYCSKYNRNMTRDNQCDGDLERCLITNGEVERS